MVSSKTDSAGQVVRRITLRELRLVLAIARSGSILKAANEIGITQPALSKSVAELETTLGVRLFDRTNRGVIATPQGRILLRRAAGVFDELHHAVDELASLRDGRQGNLRIGGTPTMCAGLLPTVISSILSQHVSLRFDVSELALESLSGEVLTSSLDLGVGRAPGNTDEVQFERLFDDRLFVVAGAHHHLAGRRSVTLQEAAGYPWMLPAAEGAMAWQLREEFERRGLTLPTPLVRTMSIQVRYELIAKNGLLTVMYGSVLRLGNTPDFLRVLPIDLDATVAIGILRLRNRTPAPSAEIFVDAARKITGPMQSLTANQLKLSLQRRVPQGEKQGTLRQR